MYVNFIKNFKVPLQKIQKRNLFFKGNVYVRLPPHSTPRRLPLKPAAVALGAVSAFGVTLYYSPFIVLSPLFQIWALLSSPLHGALVGYTHLKGSFSDGYLEFHNLIIRNLFSKNRYNIKIDKARIEFPSMKRILHAFLFDFDVKPLVAYWKEKRPIFLENVDIEGLTGTIIIRRENKKSTLSIKNLHIKDSTLTYEDHIHKDLPMIWDASRYQPSELIRNIDQKYPPISLKDLKIEYFRPSNMVYDLLVHSEGHGSFGNSPFSATRTVSQSGLIQTYWELRDFEMEPYFLNYCWFPLNIMLKAKMDFDLKVTCPKLFPGLQENSAELYWTIPSPVAYLDVNARITEFAFGDESAFVLRYQRAPSGGEHVVLTGLKSDGVKNPFRARLPILEDTQFSEIGWTEFRQFLVETGISEGEKVHPLRYRVVNKKDFVTRCLMRLKHNHIY